jgi:transcriptional regulator with XRE-family HTH domain
MSKVAYSGKYKSILKRLKTARKASYFTQSEVAKKLKKPQSYISKIELGERRVDVTELSTLAKIYKKPISFFIE